MYVYVHTYIHMYIFVSGGLSVKCGFNHVFYQQIWVDMVISTIKHWNRMV